MKTGLPMALAAAVLFVSLASWRLSEPGIQADEALFATGIFRPEKTTYRAWFFGHRVPLMQMSYLGSLKTWIYKPVFSIWRPSAVSTRLPMILAGALTIVLGLLLVRRLASVRAAAMFSLLLATDPSFLWTTRCDWGPVALQHLLSVAGALALARQSVLPAGLLFGLALWNKTTFLWLLPALVLAFFPRPWRLRAVAVFLIGFALGSYPWLRYNISTGGETATHTARFEPGEIPQRLEPLLLALAGSSPFGYLMRDGETAHPFPLRRTITPFLLLAALACTIRFRLRCAALLFAVAAASWLLMAATAGSGESLHHIVLLWPWPHAAIAVALAELHSRFPRLALAGLAAAAAANLLVLTHQYSLLARHGADPPWSGAVYPLAERIRLEPASTIYVHDWGILESVRLLTGGSRAIESTADHVIERAAADPNALWVSHTDPFQFFPGFNRRLAQVPGLQPRILYTVPDRLGRPVFQVFRFVPDPPSITDPPPPRQVEPVSR